MTATEPVWDLGDPVWWLTSGERYPGTVLRRDGDTYLVTLHDHPSWRWVEQVPRDQLADRAETPELVTIPGAGVGGSPVTTWTCPHPSHVDSTVSTHSSNMQLARAGCARYMPPLGHAHDAEFPAHMLPAGVDPATVPVWTGGLAPSRRDGHDEDVPFAPRKKNTDMTAPQRRRRPAAERPAVLRGCQLLPSNTQTAVGLAGSSRRGGT